LRGDRTARAHEHPLVQGGEPGRPVTRDARREPATVHRGGLRARPALRVDHAAAGRRRPPDRRRDPARAHAPRGGSRYLTWSWARRTPKSGGPWAMPTHFETGDTV